MTVVRTLSNDGTFATDHSQDGGVAYWQKVIGDSRDDSPVNLTILVVSIVGFIIFSIIGYCSYLNYKNTGRYHASSVVVDYHPTPLRPMPTAPPMGIQMTNLPLYHDEISNIQSNKFCGNCGSSIDSGNKFCVKCGVGLQ